MPTDTPTELLTASSGSVGDVVYSRNQHGPYTRARTAPFDPASAQQLAVRAALSECVTAWNATLTETERRDWDAFALAVRTRGRLGRSVHAGGLGMYIRANVPRIQAAEAVLPRVDQAPTLYDSGAPSPLERVVLDVVADLLHVFFNIDDPWRQQPGSAMLFYASAPQPLTRNFWAGPYRYAAPILGSTFPFPLSPQALPLPFAYAPGDRCFVRWRLTSSDGRLTAARRLTADHLPQVAPLPVSVLRQFIFPTSITDVTFDHLLQSGFLSTAPWTIRFNNFLWTHTSAQASGDAIRIRSTRGAFSPGADAVTYTPPPADVIALLTSIPAAAFTRSIPFP